MSTLTKTFKKAICVDILVVFSLFLHHFCLQNPYLWGALKNFVDALIFMLYPPVCVDIGKKRVIPMPCAVR
jgi:hypothetical protein